MPKGYWARESERENWKGDAATDHSKRSRTIRRHSLEGRQCERCDKPAEHRHHRDKNISNYDASNIALLCNSCHVKLHWHEDAEFRNNILKAVRSRPRKGLRACRICDRLTATVRRGRCQACARHFYKRGEERPAHLPRLPDVLKPEWEVAPLPAPTAGFADDDSPSRASAS